MRILFRGLVFLTAGLLSAGAIAAEVPLIAHGGALVVEATLNGRYTGRFLVDTGATYCVISKDVAKEAKISGRAASTIRLTTANGTLEASLGEARKIEVGDTSATDVEVAIIKGPPAGGFSGVLGLSFLNRFTYSVDHKSGVLRLRR